MPSPASPQYESVSATQSRSPVTADSPAPAWSKEVAAGSTETTRAATVASTQVHKHRMCYISICSLLLVFDFMCKFPCFILHKAKTTFWHCTLNGLNLNLLTETLNLFLLSGPAFITSMEFGKGRPKHDNYGNPLDPG